MTFKKPHINHFQSVISDNVRDGTSDSDQQRRSITPPQSLIEAISQSESQHRDPPQPISAEQGSDGPMSAEQGSDGPISAEQGSDGPISDEPAIDDDQSEEVVGVTPEALSEVYKINYQNKKIFDWNKSK